MTIFRGRTLTFALPVALAVLLSFAMNAHAEDAGARADALFVEGKKLNGEGKTLEASQRFAQAYALKPSADIACNLGSTEVVLKEYAQGATHLDVCLRIFPATGTPEQKAAAEKRFADARAEVTSVVVKSSVDGATILVDGAKAGQAPLAGPLFLTPGKHVITAELEGHSCAPQDVAGSKQQELTIRLTLERTKDPVVVAPKSVVPTIVLGSLAAVGTGFGIAGIVVSVNDASHANTLAGLLHSKGARCVTTSADCSAIQSALDGKATYRAMGITGFVVGGAALLGTIVYVAVPGRRGDRTALRIAPQVGDTNGVLVRGSF